MTVHFRRGSWLYRDKNGNLTDDPVVINTLSGQKEPDGLEFQARIEKSRVGRPFRTARLRIDFDDMGYDTFYELAQAAIHYGAVEKSGAWYYLLDENGERVEDEKGLHGVGKLRERIESDLDLRAKIELVWHENTRN
jgi:hypothetical protein